MSKIVNLTDYQSHKVSEVICVKCYKRWLSIRPNSVKLTELECPKCGKGYVIETGEIISEEI